LQLHDELVYEVSAAHLSKVAKVIQRCMETTTTLNVRLPVKVKVGPSWGRLEEMDV
jgi:DNA polymerase theta